MTRYDTTSIHRYLDGVFAGIPLTPDVQDLKEEIRGNLSARIAELEAAGADATAATRKAIRELGDVREIIAQLGVQPGASPGPRASAVAAYARNKVRPRPGFVVRTVLLAGAAAGGVTAYFLALGGAGDAGSRLSAGPAALVLALPFGLLVADGLRQETTSNHPLPTWRAAGYGVATTFALGGLGLVGFHAAGSPRDGWLVTAGVPLLVAAIVAFAFLGATQTNRKKAWVRAVAGDMAAAPSNALDEDPVAAARFGIYSGVLWIAAIGAFVALSIGQGFRWSWLAFLVALLVQMAMVARMVFANGGAVAKLGHGS